MNYRSSIEYAQAKNWETITEMNASKIQYIEHLLGKVGLVPMDIIFSIGIIVGFSLTITAVSIAYSRFTRTTKR